VNAALDTAAYFAAKPHKYLISAYSIPPAFSLLRVKSRSIDFWYNVHAFAIRAEELERGGGDPLTFSCK
jgi:hypothetical protein